MRWADTTVVVCPPLSLFMARKNHGSYRVTIGKQDFRVPAFWWHLFTVKGWLVRVGKRLAHLRDGVTAILEDKAMRLVDERAGVSVSIPSAWRLVERQAIYDPRGPVLTRGQLQREIQRQYCVRQ